MYCFRCGKIVHGHGRYHRMKFHNGVRPIRKKAEKPVDPKVVARILEHEKAKVPWWIRLFNLLLGRAQRMA